MSDLMQPPILSTTVFVCRPLSNKSPFFICTMIHCLRIEQKISFLKQDTSPFTINYTISFLSMFGSKSDIILLPFHYTVFFLTVSFETKEKWRLLQS